MTQRIISFWFGFTLPLRALKLILSTPALLFWSFFPAALTLLLYGFLFAEIQGFLQTALNHALLTWGLHPSGWMVSVVLFLAKVMIFVWGAMSFSYVANLVACPFNDFLAEKTERFSDPPMKPVPTPSFVRRARLITIDLFKTLVSWGFSLIALLVSWVPVLNALALILSFFTMAFLYISYPQTRRGEGIGKGILFLQNNPYSSLGFGWAFTMLFAIPFVSFFIMPLAVVGGTLLVANAEKTRPEIKEVF